MMKKTKEAISEAMEVHNKLNASNNDLYQIIIDIELINVNNKKRNISKV